MDMVLRGVPGKGWARVCVECRRSERSFPELDLKLVDVTNDAMLIYRKIVACRSCRDNLELSILEELEFGEFAAV